MDESSFYLNIINHLSDGIYYVDQDRVIRFWNRAAEEITGYRAEEIVGKRCQDSLLHHIDSQGRPLCSLDCPLFHTLNDGRERTDQVLVRHRDGYRIPVRVTIFPITSPDGIQGAVEIFTRNTPTVYEDELIDQLTRQAMHDPLTQLPNRRYTENFLAYRLEEFRRFNQPVMVLFADVDHFRNFNNCYGHATGDAVLRNIASSVRHSIRKNDLLGRWGGEEFVGICSIRDEAHARLVGEKFRSLIEHTEVISEGHTLHVTISVGVTLLRRDDTVESVVKRADTLMYASKEAGRNRVTFG